MDDKEIEKALSDARKYSMEHFQVEVKPAHSGDNMTCISVTHNGFQWSSIATYPGELVKVRDAINEYLEADHA